MQSSAIRRGSSGGQRKGKRISRKINGLEFDFSGLRASDVDRMDAVNEERKILKVQPVALMRQTSFPNRYRLPVVGHVRDKHDR